MQNNFSEIAIIGLGPAGMAAVNQFKRYYQAPRVFTRHTPGGLLKNAHVVQNYLGFSNGIAADTLIEQFTQALLHLKDSIINEDVIKTDYLPDREHFSIKTNTAEYLSKYLIVATGTRAKPLNCTIPTSLRSCVYDEPHPLFDQKDKKIVILGCGDAACVYALKLSKNNEVNWFVRGQRLKAIPVLIEAIEKNNIQYQKNLEISSVVSGICTPLMIKLNDAIEIGADYLVPAIGREPALDFMTNRLQQTIKTGDLDNRFYFAGDVQNDKCRQVSIATGDGVKAAMKIYQSMVNA